MAKEKLDIGEVEPETGFVAAPPKPIRVGRQKRKAKEEKRDSLDSRLQAKATMLADRLFERREGLRKSLGNPIKSEKLSKDERKAQYKEMIASQEMLFNSLAGAAIVGSDGRLRISNKMVDAFRELSD